MTSGFGQPSVEELRRKAAAGQCPRRDYVELAGMLDADVIDADYMERHATRIARLVARTVSLAAGQVVEGFLRRRRYEVIVAWSDRIGLPLALLLKLTRSRQRLILVSVRMTNGMKMFLVKRLRVDSHLHSIFARGTQRQLAVRELGVLEEKLRIYPLYLDEVFWQPIERVTDNMICAVGWEERDYPTLVEAVRSLPVELVIAAGTITLPDPQDVSGVVDSDLMDNTGALPANVHLGSYKPLELRELYGRSRFVVVPVRPVDFDAGVTAVTEAMAMGKAVITSRAPDLTGLFRDGEAGTFVAPGDIVAWRAAIQYLLDHPDQAAHMGQAGRARVERAHRLGDGVDRLAEVVRA